MISTVHTAGRAPLTWSVPPGVSGPAELDEEVKLAEPPELVGALSVEKKRGFPWLTLAPAVLIVGGAVTGHLTGHLTFPTVLRWSGDELLDKFDRLGELGQFTTRPDYYSKPEPISPGTAFARLNEAWGDPEAVSFSFSDGSSMVLRSREDVDFAHDFLVEGRHPGFTDEQVELLARVSQPTEVGRPDWDSRGIGAMLALQRGHELTYSLANGSGYWDHVKLKSFDDLQLLGELYHDLPSTRFTPGQRDAMVELVKANKASSYDASSAFRFYQRLSSGESVRVHHQGGILPTNLTLEVKSLEEAEQAWLKVRNQVESDRYRPSTERLARAAEPVIARYDALLGGTAAQLESVTGLAGVPGDRVSSLSERFRGLESKVDRLGELLADWRPEHQEEARQLLSELSPPGQRDWGEWWNPWTEDRMQLMNSLKSQVQELLKSQERPAPPDGWTPPLPNLEGL